VPFTACTPSSCGNVHSMRVLLLVAIWAVVGVVRVEAQGCHPVCVVECSTANATVATCTPVCQVPACVTIGCTRGVPLRCLFPACHVSCPVDQCQEGCPACETLCQPLPSVCKDAGCEIECPETECSWDCQKPSIKPEAVCEWECEPPACAAMAASHRLEPQIEAFVALIVTTLWLIGAGQ